VLIIADAASRELIEDMRALVTGGAGFVGRRFCRVLLERGWDVVCVDPIVPRTGGLAPAAWPLFNPQDFPNFTFFQEDCRNFFKRTSEHFDYAFHLAAMVGGRLMIDYEPLAVAEDLAIDAMFWRWAEIAKPKKSIYFSSSAAYPIELQRAGSYRLLKEGDISFETSLGMPDMTYGWAKLTGEYLARLAYSKYGLSSVAYRPFSGYGEDQDLTYPFPAITKRIIELTDPTVTVWGSGKQMRDFVHIDDCVSCVLSSMDQINDGSAVNISSGEFTSFIDLAKLILQRVGKRAEVLTQSDKPEGVFARAGDVALQRSLGFSPTISLEQGIDRAVRYLQSK
jgi:nucleoside-diphosphate-sugar epimerase